MNSIKARGYLTSPPRITRFDSGNAVASAKLVILDEYVNKRTGETHTQKTPITIKLWGNQADTFNQLAEEGCWLEIEGKLRLETWNAKGSGEPRSMHVITVARWEIVDGDETDANY